MLHSDVQQSVRIQSEIELMLSFRHDNVVEVSTLAGSCRRRGATTCERFELL
jgi:hypothetical protein